MRHREGSNSDCLIMRSAIDVNHRPVCSWRKDGAMAIGIRYGGAGWGVGDAVCSRSGQALTELERFREERSSVTGVQLS